VTIARTTAEQTFRIVGEDERSFRGSISHVSPLAKAMFGKRVGDTFAREPASRDKQHFVVVGQKLE